MTARATRTTPNWLLNGVLPIDMPNVPSEVIAGCTLAALAIPEVMGYTKIAGTPPITGLYTILLPVLLFALFGSSRHLVVGADSASAAIMATGLIVLAPTGSTTYVELASLTALMCAVLLIVARLLKLGFIANFLSRSVLIGFLTGVGIQVAMGQFGGLFGVSEGSGTTIEKFVNALQAIPTQTNVPTLLVSLAVLGTIIGLERVNKKIPGALIAVVGAIVLNYVFDLTARGVTDLGPVPGGLPALGLPTEVMTASNVAALLPTVVSIVIVILAQSAATSRAYAIKYGDSFEENVDLIGLGLANVGAGISGTFVVNGSPTKTSMVDNAGGKSQLAMLTTAAVVVIVLLFLTVPLSYMPNAVLSAVVFLIGIRLIDVKGMTEIYRLRKGEFAVAAATAATVVIVGVEQGIILAIFLSIVEHIYHSYHPFDRLLTLSPTGRVQYVAHGQPAQAAPGLAIFAFGATLYYANSTRFTAEVLDVIDTASPPLKWFCLASAVIGDVDYSGSDAMHSVLDEMDKRGITFVMAGVNADVRDMLDRYGLVARIGPEYFFDFVDQVVEAYEKAVPAAPNEPASPPSSVPTDPAPTDPTSGPDRPPAELSGS